MSIPTNVAGNTTGMDGITAAGMVSTFIIQRTDLLAPPTLPLSALTAATTVRIDCWLDMGDVSFDRAPTTKEKQRACAKVATKVKTGETINGTISAIWDQQAALTEAINRVYAALPEGADVFVYRAYGFDSALDPIVGMKGDLYAVEVQQVTHTDPRAVDEDIKFSASLSGENYWPDVAVSA